MIEESGNQTQSEDPADEDTETLEKLEAMLPAHLRTPLPIKGQETTVSADLPDTAAQPSAIEDFYRKALGSERLEQFGYAFFGKTDSDTPQSAGAIQDDYVLGAGDRVSISFLGERKDRKTYVIDQTGTLVIDMLPPFAALGKSLADLRRDIRHMLEVQSYHGDVFISLEQIRKLGVLVAGQVANPGRQSLSPLQTVLEALENAGGILKTGSLRQIRLVRDGKTIPIDLYPVMGADDKAQALPTLRDGDRIIVPTLGPTIAVTGDVRQPAIYELPADARIQSTAALQLAGGVLSSGQNRITLMTPQADGTRAARLIEAASATWMEDGAALNVSRSDDEDMAMFTLQGETRSKGTYPIAQYSKLSKLLKRRQIFGDDIYPLIGVVSRRSEHDLARDMIAFSPQDIYMGRADMPMQSGDIVTLFSRTDIHAVMHEEPSEMDKLLQSFIREHGVSLQGAVRLPGLWPVADDVDAAKLVDVAGGPLSDADLTRTEISRNESGEGDRPQGRETVDMADSATAESIKVGFGDAIRIPDRFEAVTRQSVTLFGEVKNPGTYDLMRGDTLLTLLERAGGLTDEAYPQGTVFSRASERRREKEKFSAAARDLERAIAMAANGEQGKVDMAQVALAKDLVNELKTIDPAGRITVESNPTVLRDDPEQDMLLEAGDKIYIPKRPMVVRVTGEVLSPAALQFRADKKPTDYISEAGGLTMHADKGRMFVLLPNGAAQPLNASQFGRRHMGDIVAGSTIVVPRDPKPFDFIESAKDITQILSNLAVTSIYAEDLIDRN